MKQMTKLENIIMNRSGCNRGTANLIANDILQEVEKDLQVEVARDIFADLERIIEVNRSGEAKFDIMELHKIEKKHTEGESNG